MNCPECNDSLLDYIDGELSQDTRECVDAHLAGCPPCREELDTLAATCKSISRLQKPSEAMEQRFSAALNEYKKGQIEGRNLAIEEQSQPVSPMLKLWRNGYAQAAMIAVAFIVGVLASNSFFAENDYDRFASIETELASLREFTAISLLNQSSASERLRGLEWIANSKIENDQTLEAVYKKLNYDPNINVRFAALETLDSYAHNSQIRSKLVLLLDTPNSPMIRAELIKLLVRRQEVECIPSLRRISQDPNENPTIRELATWSLETLNSQTTSEA